MELKARQMKKGETLEELHGHTDAGSVDHSEDRQADREGISCDCFVDALADPD